MSDIFEETTHRYGFYRDGWRTMIAVLPTLVITIVILTIALVWSMTREPEPKYFAVENGRFIPVVPVSNPYIKPGDLNQWVARAVTESYMLDFQNYRTRISDNEKYFTKEGFADYKNSLEKSGRMKMIQEGWLVGSATIKEAPIVIQEGVFNGRYVWRLRVPVIVTYASKTHKVPTQNLMLTVTVIRVNSYENPYGVGISSIIERTS